MEEGSVLFYKAGIGYRQGITMSLRVPYCFLFHANCSLPHQKSETDFFCQTVFGGLFQKASLSYTNGTAVEASNST